MYYTLEASAETAQNGCYPQITLSDYSKEGYVHNLNLDALWDTEIEFDFFKFNDGFIDTDFCTISHFNSTSGIVVSDQAKKIFEEALQGGYKFTSHRFHPILIQSKETLKKYYFLQILESKEIVDYSVTVFENQLSDKEVKINNHENYNDELYPIDIKIIEEFDLFKHPYDGELFISERLKKTIESANLTGHKELLLFDGMYELH
ncbi:MAG: imm11 family protein [Salibacteraceae bacterium]